MAIASSSSSTQHYKCHVFISFRGEDTRRNFTSHLYDAFCKKKIKAYIDEESLKKGDEISPSLMRAIQESLISVVILSENYASSSWCLDELNHILQCKETDNRIVVPVFYGVSPSQVKKQQGSYGSEFAKHEVRFKDQMDKVQHWRNSLTKVANLAGWNLSDIQSSSKLVEAILKDILEKLHHMLLCDNDFKDFVGIEKRIQHVESLLNIDSLDVRIVGIWGMGGIGKTTLARVIFNRFVSQFESHCFLENVKKESKERRLTELRKKLFSQILLDKEIDSHIVDQFTKDRLRLTKVFIVLDDVDDRKQFDDIVGGRDRFGDGSIIIVTTRDKQVLTAIDADQTYKVEELDFFESQDLLCSKAFPRSAPGVNYTNLIKRVVQYSGGIPLALEVLGSHLNTKSTKLWESELDKLETIPNSKVHNVLKISYDGLEKNEHEIFLDIACFFKGENEHFVKRLLDAYGNRFMDSGIQVLKDKALIATTPTSMLQMHDLLQEMGREIVRDESIEFGKRSRLWLAEDIFYVLKHKTGTGVVQGMSMYLLDKDADVKQLDPLAFKEMHNLKFIRFRNWWYNKFEFPQGLKFLPDELRYIYWDYYPLKYLPSDFMPRNLVELHLHVSKLEHLWNNGVPNLKNLKVLDLGASRNLIQIQDLSLAVNLEMIDLGECSSLKSLPDLSPCTNLKEINLSECSRLKSLPSSIGKLKSLKIIDLRDCEDLENVPDLSLCINLEEINLSFCSSLKSLPSSIGELKSLKRIDLRSCTHLENVPDLSLCINLEEIYLSFCSSLKSLPSNIGELKSLKRIELSSCTHLENLPNVPVNIQVLDLTGCTRLKRFPICKLKSLGILNLCDCPELEFLPDIWEPLECLRILRLNGSGIRELPPSIENLIQICRLDLNNCINLRSVPHSIYHMRIEELNLSGCSNLENFYFLTCLPPSLRNLNLSHTCLSEIPDCIFSLPELCSLSVAGTMISSIPNCIFSLLQLRHLSVAGTMISSIPDCIFSLLQLRRLSVAGTMISSIPESIKSSKELNYLDIRCCKSVRFLPELPLCIEEIDASECTSLELFSNTSIDALMDDPRVIRRTLYFLDCLKLDYNYITTEFQTRALCLEASYKPNNYDYYDSEVHVCYTGDEIPKWFNHQNNDGSRVNVKLSPHDLDFMGSFAASVVVARGDAYEEEIQELEDESYEICVLCYTCFRTNEGERNLKCVRGFYKYKNNHISNHMHIWTFEECDIDFSSVKEISVDFKLVVSGVEIPLLECEVIKCGIRLLHLQNAAEDGIISRKNLIMSPTSSFKQVDFESLTMI